MSQPRPFAAALAAEVVAYEHAPLGCSCERAVMVRLHRALGRIIGAHGFDVVLARALALAKAADPSLSSVTTEPGGILNGLKNDSANDQSDLIAVLSQLFELLMRFIGDDLTSRAVRGAWSTPRSRCDADSEREKP